MRNTENQNYQVPAKPGCHTTTAIKKLSNHIIVVHNTHDKTKLRTKVSKKPNYLKQCQPSQGPQKLIPRYDINKEAAIIVALTENLTSFDGGKCLEVTLPFATGSPLHGKD